MSVVSARGCELVEEMGKPDLMSFGRTNELVNYSMKVERLKTEPKREKHFVSQDFFRNPLYVWQHITKKGYSKEGSPLSSSGSVAFFIFLPVRLVHLRFDLNIYLGSCEGNVLGEDQYTCVKFFKE